MADKKKKTCAVKEDWLLPSCLLSWLSLSLSLSLLLLVVVVVEVVALQQLLCPIALALAWVACHA